MQFNFFFKIFLVILIPNSNVIILYLYLILQVR